MTTPVNLTVDPSAPPVASEAPGGSALDDEVRQLAAALGVHEQTALSGRKATIDAVDLGDSTTAPTVQVNLSGILIPNIRIAASYSPQVGDTVLLLKQGNEYFAAFKIQDTGSKSLDSSGGWTKPTLGGGNSHSGGGVHYRRVMDNGAWKMQWKGRMTYGGTTVLSSSLSSDFQPSEERNVNAARFTSQNSVSVRVDFATSGAVTIVGATATIDLGNSFSGGVSNHTHGGSTGFAGDSHFHTHGGTVPAASFAESHSHGIPSSDLSHSHDLGTVDVSAPTWVSFDGIEYFL